MENNFTFRQPSIYVTLPSNNISKYANIEFVSQIPIFSMSTHDELILRIPDALLNGQTTVDIIQNCCPSIRNAWDIPLNDITTILAGIRIATDGNESELTIHCQKCKSYNNYSVNLQNFISSVKNVWEIPLRISTQNGLLIINFEAPKYSVVNMWNLTDFKISKQMFQVQQVEDLEYQEELAIDLLSQKQTLQHEKLIACIKNIKIDNYVENDRNTINDFVTNIEADIFKQLQTTFIDMLQQSKLSNFKVNCAECQVEIDVNIDLDFSNNFRNQIIISSEQDILNLFQKMASQSKSLKADILKTIWFMRGSLTYSEALLLSKSERELIGTLIKENLEVTKKSGLPFF